VHLSKHKSILASHHRLACSICKQTILDYSSVKSLLPKRRQYQLNVLLQQSPLTNALCPAAGCMTVSHLKCLANAFLSQTTDTGIGMIPRGGKCTSCRKYVLWGDVVRGCYRRASTSGMACEPDETDDGEPSNKDTGATTIPGRHAIHHSRPKKATKMVRRQPRKQNSSSSEGEFFDFDQIKNPVSGSDVESDVVPLRNPRPPLCTVARTATKSGEKTSVSVNAANRAPVVGDGMVNERRTGTDSTSKLGSFLI
jgi:hypothetical protein